MADELIPAADIAKEFGVTQTTVKRWVWRGLLAAALVTPSGRMRFRTEDIQKFKLANIARHIGKLPDMPEPEETVEAKIEEFLQNMLVTHKHLVWRPASARRYDRDHRRRDAAAYEALQAAERERQQKLNDDTIKKITGRTRKEFYEEISVNSFGGVAERLGVSEDKLRDFCAWFRIPIPNDPPRFEEMQKLKRPRGKPLGATT